MNETESAICKRIGCSSNWIRKFRKENLTRDVHWGYDLDSKRAVKPVFYYPSGRTEVENAFIKEFQDDDSKAVAATRSSFDGVVGTVAAKFVNPRLVRVIVGNGEPQLCQVRDNRALHIGMEVPLRKNFGTSTPWTLAMNNILDGKHRFISLEKLIRANKL